MATQAERGLTIHAGAAVVAPDGEIDWQDVKRQFRAIVARNVTDDLVDVAITACRVLGFHPLLNHINLIDGQVYITHKGLWHLAHRSGALNGIEVLEEGETQTHYTAKVKIYRKDMDFPFVFQGRYPKGGRNKNYGPEMALARAETMALRRAFDVSMPIFEERDDSAIEGQVRVNEYAPAPSAPAAIAAPAVSDADYAIVPLPTMPATRYRLIWDLINRQALEKKPKDEIVATARERANDMNAEQYTALQGLVKAILVARKEGREWVAREPAPDALTQEIIEAEVTPAPAPPGRRVLDHETFAEVQHSIASMAHHGSADSEIKAYMSPFWQRGSDDQRQLLEKLWAAISAARQAGEIWPDPDAELQAELAYGQEEIGEPSGDPSLVDDSPFAHGAPASIAG